MELFVKTLLVVLLIAALYAMRKGLFQGSKEGGGILADLQRRRARQKAGLKELSVTVGGETIWYLEGGTGKTVVLLLHGFGCDKEVWTEFASRLVDRKLRVVAPDLPGFGHNEPNVNVKHSASRLTKVIRQFVREVGLERFHLVGHSVGALIAASYAYASPIECLSLALFEPMGLRVPYESDLDKSLSQGRNPLVTNTASGYESVLKFMTAATPKVPPATLRVWAERMAGRGPFYQQVWKDLREGDRAHLLDLLLPELEIKILILIGERSRVIHSSTAEVAQRAVVKTPAKTATVPRTGHLPMLEAPDATAQLYLDFLTGR